MRAQLQALQRQQVQQQEQQQQQQIQTLPKQDQILAKLELLAQREKQASASAHEWHVEAKRQEIIQQYGGEIDQRVLDTSTIQKLYESVPAAQMA
jgi:hypothetical protein